MARAVATGLTVGRAAVLGAVQGPTELLPVSSSAHLRIVPWLAGWDLDDEVSAEDRKTFEVAVHGGAALALLIGQRRLIADELRRLDGRRVAVIALSFLPAVAAGLALEDVDRPAARRARARPRPGWSPARWRWSSPIARPASATPARPARSTGWRSAVAQAAALAPGRLPQRLDPGRGARPAASGALRRTCSRGPWPCR